LRERLIIITPQRHPLHIASPFAKAVMLTEEQVELIFEAMAVSFLTID
jgi:hypothetical protein